MSTLSFIKSEVGWFRRSDLAGLNSFEMVKLRVLLAEALADLDELIDASSAEGQLRAEVGRRVRNLSIKAQAAGAMSDMWNNQNSRFYKERLVIEKMLDEHVEA